MHYIWECSWISKEKIAAGERFTWKTTERGRRRSKICDEAIRLGRWRSKTKKREVTLCRQGWRQELDLIYLSYSTRFLIHAWLDTTFPTGPPNIDISSDLIQFIKCSPYMRQNYKHGLNSTLKIRSRRHADAGGMT